MDEASLGRGAAAWGPGSGAMTVLVLFGVSLAYAIFRYIVVGPVPAAHLSLFVLNKAAACTALVALAAALLASAMRNSWHAAQPGNWLDPARMGAAGTRFALVHVAASLLVLTPAYHPSLYGGDGTFTGLGEASMLAAVLAVVSLALGWPHVDARRAQEASGWRRAVVWLGLLHVTLLGLRSWGSPQDWHGGLPPISLLSALVGGGLIVAGFWARRARRRNGTTEGPDAE